jgi:hypothetical protein
MESQGTSDGDIKNILTILHEHLSVLVDCIDDHYRPTYVDGRYAPYYPLIPVDIQSGTARAPFVP